MQRIDDYINYFQHLAEQHEEINHQPGSGNKAFFRINIEEVLSGFRTEIKDSTNSAIMVLIDYDWRGKSTNGQEQKVIMCGFYIIGHHQRDDYQAQLDTLKRCEIITEQILNRITHHSQDGHPFFNYSVNTINDVKVNTVKEIGDTSMSGTETTFFVTSQYDCTIDSAQWKDL